MALSYREKRSLDNYITGHYGEDQYRGACDVCHYTGNLCDCGRCQQHCICDLPEQDGDK